MVCQKARQLLFPNCPGLRPPVRQLSDISPMGRTLFYSNQIHYAFSLNEDRCYFYLRKIPSLGGVRGGRTERNSLPNALHSKSLFFLYIILFFRKNSQIFIPSLISDKDTYSASTSQKYIKSLMLDLGILSP